MPSQPAGAVTTVAGGAYVEAKFSADGTRLYAVSGNVISVIDAATGGVVTQYTVGIKLGAADLTVDGHYLLVPEASIGTSGSLYRIDLTSGAISTYTTPITEGAFYDVASLSDGTALITQSGTGQTGGPARILDFVSGQFSIPGGVTSPISSWGMATLTASSDHTHVLVRTYSIQEYSYFYVAGAGITTRVFEGPADPYAGAAVPPSIAGIEATSPDSSLNVTGGSLNVYDGALHRLTSLGTNYPYLTSAQGLAFSPDGQKLYVASGSMLVVFSTSTWEAIGAYSLGAAVALARDSNSGANVGYGDIVQASADGHYVSVIETSGIQLIDLTRAHFDATLGDDVISGSGSIYGFAGNDDLSGVGPFPRMYGGTGDDTYHITSENASATEYANQGHDTVYSSVSFSLGDNIEDLVLDGVGPLSGYGNALDNHIVGNSGSNELGGGEATTGSMAAAATTSSMAGPATTFSMAAPGTTLQPTIARCSGCRST